MTRRTLIPLLLLPKTTESYPQTDLKKLNRFAEQYNKYISELGEGKIDVKTWKAVLDAWAALK